MYSSFQRNIFLFKISNFFSGFWPLNVLAIVYFQNITHSYAYAMSIFSLLYLTTTCMEIPTGIFSDKIGRKKSLIMGSVLIFLCFLLWALASEQENGIYYLFLGAFLKGIGDAFISGTDEAFMYETLQKNNQHDHFDILYAHATGWMQVGQASSAITAAAIMYYSNMNILAYISVIPAFLNMLISFFYTEITTQIKVQQKNSLKHFLSAFLLIIRNKKLRLYSIIQMCYMALGNGSYYFEGAYYETLISKWMINIVRFIKQAFGVFSFFIIPKIRMVGMEKLYFFSMLGNATIRLVGVLVNTSISPFVIAFGTLFYGSTKTSGATLLQQEFSSEQRATMKSIISLGSSLLTSILMYILGLVADIFSPQISMLSAIIPIVFLALLTHTFQQSIRTKSSHIAHNASPIKNTPRILRL